MSRRLPLILIALLASFVAGPAAHAASLVTPAAAATVGPAPSFSWTLGAGETFADLSLASIPTVDSEGRFLEGYEVEDGSSGDFHRADGVRLETSGGDAVRWQRRASAPWMLAGTYWWMVAYETPPSDPADEFSTTLVWLPPRRFTVAEAVRAVPHLDCSTVTTPCSNYFRIKDSSRHNLKVAPRVRWTVTINRRVVFRTTAQWMRPSAYFDFGARKIRAGTRAQLRMEILRPNGTVRTARVRIVRLGADDGVA